jgi:hypothetical protein
MPRRIVLCAAFAFATFALMLGGHNAGSARAGTAAPNVDGKGEGTWMHPAGSGQITLELAQEGTRVTGKQSLAAVIPVFEGAEPIRLGTEVREGHLEDSTLIFYVGAPDTPGGPSEFHPCRERRDHDRHSLWLYLRHAETEKSAILRWVVTGAAPRKASGAALRTISGPCAILWALNVHVSGEQQRGKMHRRVPRPLERRF